LFLDEMPEFKKHVLEVMRQPIEDNTVTISRAATTVSYPANFILVGAMNPCPCGYFSDPLHRCICSPENIARYMGKISGPLLDRIDIHLEVPAVKYEDLTSVTGGEKSEPIRDRVNRARRRQLERFKEYPGVYCNAHMETVHLRKFCQLTDPARGLFKTALVKLGLSARAYDRILKVARTIADMDQAEQLDSHHVAEAIQYRSLDRKLWLNS
jgi:magnesium chelatase family protein